MPAPNEMTEELVLPLNKDTSEVSEKSETTHRKHHEAKGNMFWFVSSFLNSNIAQSGLGKTICFVL